MCFEAAPLVKHHIYGREVKGFDRKSHTCWICATCHDRLHKEKGEKSRIVLEGWYSTTGGRLLVWHNEGEPSITGNAIDPFSYGEQHKNQDKANSDIDLDNDEERQKGLESILEKWRMIRQKRQQGQKRQ